MVERNALLISFRWEKVRSPLQLYIIIHLGMFVRGPAFWQSAATCRVPLRPSYRCSTLAVGLHLRSVACMQIASSHPATGVTESCPVNCPCGTSKTVFISYLNQAYYIVALMSLIPAWGFERGRGPNRVAGPRAPRTLNSHCQHSIA